MNQRAIVGMRFSLIRNVSYASKLGLLRDVRSLVRSWERFITRSASHPQGEQYHLYLR